MSLLFAETKADDLHTNGIRVALQQQGYRTFGLAARSAKDSLGRLFHCGGMVVALAPHLKGRCARAHSSEQGDMITMDLCSCFLTFAWQRERGLPDGGLDYELSIAQQLAARKALPWAAAGDWNQLPLEHHWVHEGFSFLAPTSEGQLLPSRFTSDRYIAFLVQDASAVWTDAAFAEEVLSDHKVLLFKGVLPGFRMAPRYLRPTPALSKPPSVSGKEWEELLAETWLEVSKPTPRGAPDVEWADFCAALEDAFDRAAAAFGHAFRRQGTRAKGSVPVKMKEGEYRRLVHKAPSFQERKLEKLLGRLYEVARQGASCDPGLRSAVTRTWPRDAGPLPDVATAISIVKDRLQSKRDEVMHKQVSQWKHRMAQGGRAAKAWLKQQTTVAPHTLLACAASPQAHPPSDSVDACFASLRTFWDTIWQRPEVPEELERLRSGRLTRRPGLPMPGDWRISPREFRSALQRKVHGAPGCDGWRCEELLALPLQVWQYFLSLWEAWCAKDSFPTAWQHARQTFLPKVEVVDGCTPVDKMRPICIQPIVCQDSAQRVLGESWILDLGSIRQSSSIQATALRSSTDLVYVCVCVCLLYFGVFTWEDRHTDDIRTNRQGLHTMSSE